MATVIVVCLLSPHLCICDGHSLDQCQDWSYDDCVIVHTVLFGKEIVLIGSLKPVLTTFSIVKIKNEEITIIMILLI